MKKQFLKSLSIPVVTLLVVFATSALTANAQMARQIYAQIPFDFVVGNTTLCAGKYSISSETQDGSALLVRNVKEKASAIRLTNEIQSQSNKTKSRLVFHRYGQTYFLAEVWKGDNTGRKLHVSPAERALQRERELIGQNTYETVELYAIVR